jgi:peptidoglycan/LPS O-acetylase OafA/YrhL
MHPNRIASLDLLRGVAAFSVAIPHYVILALGASDPAERVSVLAVEVFFVLSGFVLAPQILACRADGRAANLGIFLVRRWMRTIPPYMFALLLISIVSGELFTADFLRYAMYVQNLFAQHNTHDYFPVAWSLSIEEWFYVTFPVWLIATTRLLRRADGASIGALALGFIAAITLARTLLGHHDDWGPEVRRVVVFRVDSIAYGFVLFLLVQRLGPRLRLGAPVAVAAAALLFAIVSVATFAAATGVQRGVPGLVHLFPFCAAAFGMSAIILCYALRHLFQATKLVAACCDRLGKISYSVYLFHLMIAMVVRALFADLAVATQVALFVGGCVGASLVFFRFFERPILAARPRYRFDPAAQRQAGLTAEASSAARQVG